MRSKRATPHGSRATRPSAAEARAEIRRVSSGRRRLAAIRQTINDNFLVVVMLETVESIINADEIANTFGLDVVIQGNSDLSQFSGWNSSDARYEALLTISHNATLKAGKYWGNAGQQYLTGHRLSPSTRFVQNGPSHDGVRVPVARTRSAGASKIATSAATSYRLSACRQRGADRCGPRWTPRRRRAEVDLKAGSS